MFGILDLLNSDIGKQQLQQSVQSSSGIESLLGGILGDGSQQNK